MAVEPTGTPIEIQSSANTGSQGITVPADATAIEVCVSGYESGVAIFSGGGMTLNGVPLLENIPPDEDFFKGGQFYLVNPATGSQTLAWDWAGTSAVTMGVIMVVTFRKGVDTADPIRDSFADQFPAEPFSTDTLTAQTGDLVSAWSWMFGGSAEPVTWTNAGEIDEFGSFNFANGSLAEAAPSGNVQVTANWDTTSDGGIAALVWKAAGAAAPQEQEGARFRNDDGDEDAATWLAAQDANIARAVSLNTRLRLLVNGTGDPASAQYRLDYKKSTDPTYVPVPLVASEKTTPVMESGDATVTTIGTAADPWAINVPNASIGDLLIFVIAWDDSTNVASVAAPAGPNGETIASVVGPQASASTEMRMQAWQVVCTGAWSAGTVSFNPSASETCRAVVIRVPAGEFDPTTPVGASAAAASAGTAESNVNGPAFSAGATDGSGRLVLCYGSDADAITAPASGTSTVNNATGGGVGLCVVTRDTAVANSESISAITATIASDSWASLGFVVRAPTVSHPIHVSASANIAASGEATTAQLTAPAGKTTADFVAGRIMDDENPADAVDLGADEYTELEWCLQAQSGVAQDGDVYQFRVTVGGTPLDTYSVTPEWTIGEPVTKSLLYGRPSIATLLLR